MFTSARGKTVKLELETPAVKYIKTNQIHNYNSLKIFLTMENTILTKFRNLDICKFVVNNLFQGLNK